MAFLSAQKKKMERAQSDVAFRADEASTSLFIQAVVANLQLLATSFCVEFEQFHFKNHFISNSLDDHQALVSVINGTLQAIRGSSTGGDRGPALKLVNHTHICYIVCGSRA